MTDIGLLWRTVRHLKPVQVYGRLWFRMKRVHPDLSPAPALRIRGGDWVPVPGRIASMTGPLRFRFLNEERSLGEAGWDDPALPKLWRYNLHYFDDLQAVDWHSRAEWHPPFIARWIADNPPGLGSGWEPYPLSLRIVNWVKWLLAGQAMSCEALHSLAVQARALSQRLEWHLLGNHLFANAKALLFAGHAFDGPEAATWRNKGFKILIRELDEQFLPDGAQFELSPMYHALGVEDLLDLLNLTQAFPGLAPMAFTDRLRQHAGRALVWLDRLSHPDGRIAFFNDAAFGIAPENIELARYAERLGFTPPPPAEPLLHLAHSGYARLESGPAVLFTDLARIGPNYLPGHAHADSLSFELSLFGRRIFVNSGTGEYGDGPERLRQRGTAAHNTVVMGGKDSSEVWSSFRVGRRAQINDVELNQARGVLTAQASHDGYAHLPGRPIHHRRFVLSSDKLVIEDELCGAGEARYHLHPNIDVGRTAQGVELRLVSGQRITLNAGPAALRTEAATWHPRFGLAIPNTCLVLPLKDGRARLELSWI